MFPIPERVAPVVMNRFDDRVDAGTKGVAVNHDIGSVEQQRLGDGCFGNIHDVGGYVRVAGALLTLTTTASAL